MADLVGAYYVLSSSVLSGGSFGDGRGTSFLSVRKGYFSDIDPSEGIMPMIYLVFRPKRTFHWKKLSGFPLEGLTISKKTSNWTLKWFDTSPVLRFNISAAE